MSITVSRLTKNEYEELRYELIKLLEEGGHENFDLYTDSKGLVTTGVGFNLNTLIVLESVLSMGFDVKPVDIRTYAD